MADPDSVETRRPGAKRRGRPPGARTRRQLTSIEIWRDVDGWVVRIDGTEYPADIFALQLGRIHRALTEKAQGLRE